MNTENRPTITTLCGSTRFPEAFALVNMHLSLMGRVVLSVGMCAHADNPPGSRFLAHDGDETTTEKQQLDQLHFRKIYLSDGIFVVNPGGYVGSSTKREIEYARSLGKSVEWLFPLTQDPTMPKTDDAPGSVTATEDDWHPMKTAPKDATNVSLRNERYGESLRRWVWDLHKRAWYNGMQWWHKDINGPTEWKLYKAAPPAPDASRSRQEGSL